MPAAPYLCMGLFSIFWLGAVWRQSVFAFASLKLAPDTTLRPAVSARLPTRRPRAKRWWARQDSNLQPDRYERPALTIELQAPPACRSRRHATVPTPLTMLAGDPAMPCSRGTFARRQALRAVEQTGRCAMFRWAVICLVISLVAGGLGLTNISVFAKRLSIDLLRAVLPRLPGADRLCLSVSVRRSFTASWCRRWWR